MSDVATCALTSPLLFAGLLAARWLGARLGKRALEKDPEHALDGTGPVEGAIFGLLGLLLAFNFTGAAARFDNRRVLITQEANAVGTAWLRLDLLPEDRQHPLRDLFRRYLDARITAQRGPPGDPASSASDAEAVALQQTIWAQVIGAVKQPGIPYSAGSLMVGATNEMFDIATTRAVSTETHPPGIIDAMLFVLSLASALLSGFAVARGKKVMSIHAVAFAAILTAVIHVTADLEYPRQGWVRIDSADHVLIELRSSMDPAR